MVQPSRGVLKQVPADLQGPVEGLAQELLAGEDLPEGDILLGHHGDPSLGRLGRRRVTVDGRRLEGQVETADPGEVDGQAEQIGTVGQRRKSPGEGHGKLELVRRLGSFGELEHLVLEGQEHPGLDLEREVQVKRSVAPFLGMQLDLPGLAQRVGLDEVALVVDVESVLDGMILELRHVPGDVYHCHAINPTATAENPRWQTLVSAGGSIRVPSAGVADDDVLAVLHRVASEIRHGLDDLDDWGLAGTREGQYRSDLVADGVALELLEAAGFGVLSEESGIHHPERPIMVVIDPVDGSTNASRNLPWWATSLCAIDARGPVASVVVNQATGASFDAVREGGARCDGVPIAPSGATSLSHSILASNGYPGRYIGWAQFRCLGAAALDLCAVACGQLDVFIDCGETSLAPWDYLGGMLICREAGAFVTEAFGRDLVVVEHGPRRTVVAAATGDLLGEAVAARTSLATGSP